MSLDLWRRLREQPDLVNAAKDATGSPLAAQTALRAAFDPPLVPLALTLAECRRRAAGKFPFADRLWTDTRRLEQATSWPVAVHKATRFQGPVADLCCGLGGDSLAIAGGGCDVRAVDIDPVCGVFVRANAEAVGVSDRVRFEAGDVTHRELGGLIHIDPDQRAGPRRTRRIEQYRPPLAFLQELTGRAAGGAIKLSPASNFGGKFPGCELELTSLGGECKEATVWFGDLAGDVSNRATVLRSLPLTALPLEQPTVVVETLTGDPLAAIAEEARPQPGEYLLDPDPAVVRAGLIDQLCVDEGLFRTDGAEEYLCSGTLPDSAFVTPFRVLGETANNTRAIRDMLAAAGIGPLEVKTRHVGADANRMQKRFRGRGDRPGVLFIARVSGQTRAVLTERLSHEPV